MALTGIVNISSPFYQKSADITIKHKKRSKYLNLSGGDESNPPARNSLRFNTSQDDALGGCPRYKSFHFVCQLSK